MIKLLRFLKVIKDGNKMDDQNFTQNIFALNFVGQEVEFIMSVYFKSEDHSEEGSLIQQNPLAVRGFVLDIDDEYIYLGSTPDGITQFVKRDLIAGGSIVDKKDEYDEALENLKPNGSIN